MTSLVNKSYATLGTILASAVTGAGGTFTVAYPSGTSQLDFNKGLANLAGCYIVVNQNDKIAYGTSGVYVGISFGASNITITNNAGYTIPAGAKVDVFLDVKDGQRQCIPLFCPPLATFTAADILTDIQLGVDGTLEYAEFCTTIAVTTAAKAATLGFTIDTVAVPGLTLALTSATVTPKGANLPFGLPTSGNTITRKSKIGLNASSVTTFVEGEGYVNLYVRHSFADQY